MPDGGGFFLSESRIAIIGLGLMGGSLALALKGKCGAIFGIDNDQHTLEIARQQHIADLMDSEPVRLLSDADVVILAVPVPAILDLLEQLPSIMPNPCIVIDVGSTKEQICEAMAQLTERFSPIGGHPICGKEKLTLANADRTLYHDAPFILTPLERTSPRALSAAQQIIEAIGAKAVVLDAAEHDRALAATSHLPFILSSALVHATPDEAFHFIGPGFKSASRLAGTSSSVMLGVLQSNRRNVTKAVVRFRTALDEIEIALATEDDSRLKTLLDQAASRYADLISVQ
jgi:prephenate dehydrogenase